MKTVEYAGMISVHVYGEYDEALFISSVREPLAGELENIKGKRVTARYWITDRPTDKDSAITEFLKTLDGDADVVFNSRYSEYTGYLWTDEWLNIGGHDLIDELKSNVGKWLILELDIY